MNNVHILFQEKQTGSLESEKLADLIVMDRDVLTCSVNDIKDVKVMSTFLAGK